MADEGTDEGTKATDSERAKPGASFPQMSLPAAVAIIHDAGRHGADQTLSSFAGYCGHQSTNSGSFRQKVADFKDWGLIKVASGRVTLTERGKRFAAVEEPLADRAALAEAFLACKIMHDFYDASPRDRPQKADALSRKAVIEFQISGSNSSRFIASLTDSAIGAGLAMRNDQSGDITFLFPEQADDSDDNAPEPPMQDGQRDTPAPAPPAPPLEMTPQGAKPRPVLNQLWSIGSGEITLSVTSTNPLPASAFTLIGAAVEAIQTLADALNAAEGTTQDDAS